jgi:phospholipid transport system substrate-binding protein
MILSLRLPHIQRRSALMLGIVLYLSAVTASTPCRAADPPAPPESPEALIRRMVDAVFAILRDPDLAKDRKRRMQRLRQEVDTTFDWVTMAKSSLGHHWRTASEAERVRFVEVFKELLAQQYMEDVDRFRGNETVTIRGSERTPELVIVKTILLTSSREQVPMDYTLHEVDGRYWVVDLAIEGVSLVNHYRRTFGRYLVNKTLAELLAQLERKLGRS